MGKKNSVGIGAFALVFGGLLSKALGAVFRLPLTNLLGLSGIGVFSLVMSLFSFSLVLTSGGVTNSLSKLISSALARGEDEKVRIYVSNSLIVTLVASFLLGVAFACLGSWISSLQKVEAESVYLLFPLLLPLGGALCVFRGAFQGRRNMFPTAISQLLEQLFKFVFGLLFAWIFVKNSVQMGIFGAFLGMIISEAISLLFLMILYYAKFHKYAKIVDMKLVRIAKSEFNQANTTLMLSALILPLVSAIDSLFIVQRLVLSGLSEADATALFGLQSGVVGTILNVPLVISVSISTALLPNLSYKISQGEKQKHEIENTLACLLFFVLPTTFGIVAISQPLLEILYPSISSSLVKIAQSLFFYGGFGIVLTALMQFFAMILQAFGEFRYLLFSSVIGGIFKLIFSFFLSSIPSVNIFALVIGNIALSGTISLLSLLKVKRICPFSVSIFKILNITFATIVMFLLVKLVLSLGLLSQFWSLFFAVVLGCLTYFLVCTPFLLSLRKDFGFKNRFLCFRK